jgi:hypothetical protein
MLDKKKLKKGEAIYHLRYNKRSSGACNIETIILEKVGRKYLYSSDNCEYRIDDIYYFHSTQEAEQENLRRKLIDVLGCSENWQVTSFLSKLRIETLEVIKQDIEDQKT